MNKIISTSQKELFESWLSVKRKEVFLASSPTIAVWFLLIFFQSNALFAIAMILFGGLAVGVPYLVFSLACITTKNLYPSQRLLMLFFAIQLATYSSAIMLVHAF